MTSFEKFDQLITGHFGVDFWSDFLILEAQDAVANLVDADWLVLRDTWAKRPADWQYRCAQVLAWGPPNHAIPILVEMIRLGDDELVITAADSLRDFEQLSPATLSPVLIARLDGSTGKSRLNRLVVQELMKRLGRRP
jgi:hypothetical protein